MNLFRLGKFTLFFVMMGFGDVDVSMSDVVANEICRFMRLGNIWMMPPLEGMR